MSLHKLFKTDANLERDGIIIDYGPNEDLPAVDGVHPPMRFRLARAGGSNQAHAKAMERVTKPHKRAIQTGNLSNDRARELDRTAFLDACLLGWENVTDAAGQVLDFSRENAEQLFIDLPDLYSDLREQCNNASLYREEVLEADLGNSGRSLSTGSSRGR